MLVVSIVQIENNWMGARAGHPHPSYNQAIVVLTENLCLLVGLCVSVVSNHAEFASGFIFNYCR